MGSSPLSEAAFDILLSLACGPLHGYAMIQSIEQMREGRTMQPGLLYTTLPKLLDACWVELAPSPAENTDKRRRYYRLTQLGQAALAAEADRRVVQAKRVQDMVNQWGHA